MIKTGEGDDPIGLLTVLDTSQPGGAAAEKPLQEFRAFLLRGIKDAADQEKLRAVRSHHSLPPLVFVCARMVMHSAQTTAAC